MLAYAGQAILHGCIAAVFIEGVLRAWHVQAPGPRIRLRLVALLAPLLSPVVLPWLLPARATYEFVVRWSLYSGASWDNLRLGGTPLSDVATVILGAAGLGLFVRDLWPLVSDTIGVTRAEPAIDPDAASAARIEGALSGLPADRGAAANVVLLRTSAAVLYCSGVDRPRITISTTTLDLLDDQELRAAMAHELVHVRRKDPARGWLLMALRTIQAFNPAVHIVGRQIVYEVEHRADRDVAFQGLAAPLARAVAKLSDRGSSRSDLAAGWRTLRVVESFAERAARHAAAARCERILTAGPVPPAGTGTLHAALAAGALAVLLVFVV